MKKKRMPNKKDAAKSGGKEVERTKRSLEDEEDDEESVNLRLGRLDNPLFRPLI
jgi:hypothetical protein